MEAIDEWLPNLSDQLIYSRKTYPVIVHGIPTSFDTSWDSKDILEHLIDYNSDIFEHPSAILGTKFLGGKRGRASLKAHGSLILHLTDPTIVHMCIDCRIAFDGGLLPASKFVCCPP